MDVAATRCAVWRVVSLSIVAFVSMALAGCAGTGSSVSSLFSGSGETAVSSPVPALPSLAIAQIIGAPADVTSKLSAHLNTASRERNIPLLDSERDADYSVRGYLVAASDSKGVKLSYIWDLSDRSGKRVPPRIQGDEILPGRKGGDPWAVVDDEAVRRLAQKTSAQLQDWLGKAGRPAAGGPAQISSAAGASSLRASRPAGAAAGGDSPIGLTPVTASVTPSSAGPGGAVTFVSPVTGAPGDGQNALTSAMKRHLGQHGVKLAEGHAAGVYTVMGSVQMGAAEGGQQPITIRWLVKDPSGKALANAVVQRNKVPAGSLDGAWGDVANLAAGEAARKVAELLPKPSS